MFEASKSRVNLASIDASLNNNLTVKDVVKGVPKKYSMANNSEVKLFKDFSKFNILAHKDAVKKRNQNYS